MKASELRAVRDAAEETPAARSRAALLIADHVSYLIDLLAACEALPRAVCDCNAHRGHMSGCAFAEALRAVEDATAVVHAVRDTDDTKGETE